MPEIQVGGHKRGVERFVAEIDEEDLEKVKAFKWSAHKGKSNYTKYVHSHTGGKKILLHRFLMGLGDYKDDKRIIDHKDGNGLNNKKENLTICDQLYNAQSFRRHHGTRNVGCVRHDPTGANKRTKEWRAVIKINGVKHDRRFVTEQEGKDWIKSLIPN